MTSLTRRVGCRWTSEVDERKTWLSLQTSISVDQRSSTVVDSCCFPAQALLLLRAALSFLRRMVPTLCPTTYSSGVGQSYFPTPTPPPATEGTMLSNQTNHSPAPEFSKLELRVFFCPRVQAKKIWHRTCLNSGLQKRDWDPHSALYSEYRRCLVPWLP